MSQKKIINPVNLQSNIYKIVRGGSYAHYSVKVTERAVGVTETKRILRGFRICLKRK